MSQFCGKIFCGALGLALLCYTKVEAAESKVCSVKPSAIAQEKAQKRGINVGSQEYGLEEIQDGVYWGTDGNFSFTLVTTGKEAILIDTLVADHFSILGNREDVETTIAYLEDLRQSSVAALQ